MDKIIEKMKKENIKYTRFLYMDNDGVIRGNIAVGNDIEKNFETGQSFSIGMPFFSVLDNSAPDSKFGCLGELSAVPDKNTFKVLPYASNTAAVICDFVKKGTHEASGVCARSILKEVLKSIDFDVNIGFENEFYVLKKDENGKLIPFDRSLCFASDGMNKWQEVMDEIISALEAQGIVVEKYHPEYGAGQHEIVMKYNEALKTCDEEFMFRETVRGICNKHGLLTSFMPKPFQDQAGSGMHMHISLWKDGKNLLFDDNDKYKLSNIGRYFVGGILRHIKALCAFTAPTVNSYKRLVPHSWASAFTCYGFDNREAPIRIISGQKGNEEKSYNIEFKPIDGTCNPYLAAAVILAAGMDGVKNKIEPGKPVLCDPLSFSEEEQAKKRISRLPETLGQSIEELENDEFFKRMFTKDMYEEYIKLKRFQWTEYIRYVSDWEFNKYVGAY